MPWTVQNALILGFGLLAMATTYFALVVVSEDWEALRSWFTGDAGPCITFSARS